jgi:hypothetical protein
MEKNDSYLGDYSIDSTNYTGVYKLFYQNPTWYYFPELPDSGYYYLKAGVGIIKDEYYRNGQKTVYELIDYHIN